MGLIADITRAKQGCGPGDLSEEEIRLYAHLNKLFYAAKKPEEELKFIKQIFTRGTQQAERVGLHASAIIVSEHEFCVRQQVLSLLYKQSQGENIPIELRRIFAEGDAIHEKWQRLLIRGGFGTYKDMDKSQFNEEYQLSFTPDALVNINDTDWVCEIKSMNTMLFAKANGHPSGQKQAQLYMHFTGRKRGFVLLDDKNTQKFRIITQTYDEGVVAPFIERLDAVQYYKRRLIKLGKMVKRHDECTSYLCKMALKCPLRDACYDKGIGRVRLNV